jgi:predicted metal-dependent phosphoesterase TrpH
MFVKEHVPAGLSAQKTIEILRSQGAFISVSHPFDSFREGHWELSDLLNIADSIDAIEVFNSRCLLPRDNSRAINFSQQHNLLATVGSDPHSLIEIGTATFTLPDFYDPASLQAALKDAQAHVRLSPPWVHLYSRYAAWRNRSKPSILWPILQITMDKPDG